MEEVPIQRVPDYFLAGFFLLPLLSTTSGPCHSRSPGVYETRGCEGIGQCFPALHLLQLSEGGDSTVFCSLPYFLRGTRSAGFGGT
ncbi:MAG: hypothetical protein CM1200mP32_12060 [Methanobacteriota archaeon]|nr:MAG: hypothetical protein CM1200mP32_12060 [Euryarchaeota archaeon]